MIFMSRGVVSALCVECASNVRICFLFCDAVVFSQDRQDLANALFITAMANGMPRVERGGEFARLSNDAPPLSAAQFTFGRGQRPPSS
jgi:hypothetical protein